MCMMMMIYERTIMIMIILYYNYEYRRSPFLLHMWSLYTTTTYTMQHTY